MQDLMHLVLSKLPPAELARRLMAAGYDGKVRGQPFDESSIYAWGNGTGKPRADVFLFAVREAGLSVDRALAAKDPLEERLGRAERQVKALAAALQAKGLLSERDVAEQFDRLMRLEQRGDEADSVGA